MGSECSQCKRSLRPGDRIIQVSAGVYYWGYETPTYHKGPAILSEGHERCYKFTPSLQSEPYVCDVCFKRIRSRSRVIYAVTGTKPGFGYSRPEGRGHEMPFIAHERCWMATAARNLGVSLKKIRHKSHI